MADEKVDVLVCRLPENVVLLSGHWPLNGWSFLVFPLEGRPVCIVPHCDENEAAEKKRDEVCSSGGTALWLVSDMAGFVTGAVVPVDGGFTAFSGV